jgi:15-cis-phytoene synthase
MGSVNGAVTPPTYRAGTSGPLARIDERADERACRLIVGTHARTFYIASRLLPERKRRGAYAIYATCRTADDIVDARGFSVDDGATALRRFRDAAFRALDERAPDPILRELSRAMEEFQVPPEALAELFGGLERDIGGLELQTWEDLRDYCEGVAGSVGEMCCAVFGVPRDQGGRRSAAVSCARTLGVAMQLTNILRDIGEDAARDRCYLPTEELARFGIDRTKVLARTAHLETGAWQALMSFQVARARDFYRLALPGIALLQRDSQRCALACAAGYAKILDVIERSGFDTVTRRVSASRLTLFGVAWRSWWGELPRFAGETPSGPTPNLQAPG